MSTRKRTTPGSGFSSDYIEETASVEGTTIVKTLIQEEVKVEEEIKEEIPPAAEKTVDPAPESEPPKIEEKSEKKKTEKEPQPETAHLNPAPSQVKELIRPRRNIPRFAR